MNRNENIAYIYVLENEKDRIVYVGQTLNPERRKKEHFNKPIPVVKEDMDKFGIDSFSFKIVDECSYRHRYIVEAWWTRKYAETHALYNQKLGIYHTFGTKKRLSEVTSGKNNGMYGRKGRKAINGQKVWAYDIEGNVVHEFNSVRMAMNFIGVKSHSKLIQVCKTGEQYYNYYWKKTTKNM